MNSNLKQISKSFFSVFKKYLSLLLLSIGLIVILFVQFFEIKNSNYSIPKNAIYLDTKFSDEVRIADLLSHMTLEEKIGQMALVEKNSLEKIDDLHIYSLGGLLSGGGAGPENNSPEDWKNMVDEYVHKSSKSRLGIPILYGADSVNGNGNVKGATIFPHFIGLGATGDADLVERVARATAKESAALGIRWSYSPNADMPHDIRWGRVYESFSNDPYLTGQLVRSYIRGLHQIHDDQNRLSILATAKHYLGAGGMEWGKSTSEVYLIDQGVTPEDERALREEYLLPFKEAVDEGVLSIMAGLNMWGDTKLSANKYLLTDVLKEELEFDGFVVSDWYGVYEVNKSKYDSLVISVNAGVDMIMIPYDYKPYSRYMLNAVERGDISINRIDDAVTRILRAKFALGLFDKKIKIKEPIDIVGNDDHWLLAREAVQKSLVLLKNQNSTLPLSTDISHIRVVGSGAHNIGRQSGGWTIWWQGMEGNDLPGAISILNAIQQTVSEDTHVEFVEDGNFVTGGMSDIGIAIISEKPYAEGVGDNPNPKIDDADLEAIQKLRQNSRKVIVIILSGRPLIITEELSNWDSAIATWLPGGAGLGVADMLFGGYQFTGKLPLPWPRSIEQLPISKEGISSDGTSVLFDRGYGLEI